MLLIQQTDSVRLTEFYAEGDTVLCYDNRIYFSNTQREQVMA